MWVARRAMGEVPQFSQRDLAHGVLQRGRRSVNHANIDMLGYGGRLQGTPRTVPLESQLMLGHTIATLPERVLVSLYPFQLVSISDWVDSLDILEVL